MISKKHPTSETEPVAFPAQITYGSEYRVKQKELFP